MNEQKELDLLISKCVAEGKRPRLLLHCCCAPCASYCLEYLTPYFEITAFYYNPNITDEEEYMKRRNELCRLADIYGVKVIDGGYDSELFLNRVQGMEGEPEGGKRCRICFFLRLGMTAKLAADYDYFATTLTISPLKNAELINSVGTELGEIFGSNYLKTDFKKKGGYQRSVELSKKYDLYRQNYCGCIYSKGIIDDSAGKSL